MMNRWLAAVSASAIGLLVITQSALAQRPPSGNQGPQQLSIEKAWAWITARPGVMIAILIIVVAIIYMIVSKRRSST